ncbi:uncharacterized protein LOC117170912 [Belonocnema kinseyi]|uniref:uncharacterized protein LOC117170912 n=1 Tax=Belonocnema kinseyi TaxID=2817044 RepID=UPI00143E083E|nr:uncharacterized protein LOC117170912 [Belonocnema kinseyi]
MLFSILVFLCYFIYISQSVLGPITYNLAVDFNERRDVTKDVINCQMIEQGFDNLGSLDENCIIEDLRDKTDVVVILLDEVELIDPTSQPSNDDDFESFDPNYMPSTEDETVTEGTRNNSLSNFVNVSGLVLAQGQSAPRPSTMRVTDPKKVAKKNACKFCHKKYHKLKRHLVTVHRKEEEVMHALSLPMAASHVIFESLQNQGR